MSFVKASTDLECTAGENSNAQDLSIKYVNEKLTISFTDEDGINQIDDYADFDYITYHYIIMVEETGIVLDIINMEGKALWNGEFLSNIQCKFL